MGCIPEPVLTGLMGVLAILTVFVLLLVLLVHEARESRRRKAERKRIERILKRPIAPMPPGVMTDDSGRVLCACGNVAKGGGLECGPCSRGETITAPIGGQPIGGG